MDSLELVRLPELMAVTSGRPEVVVGLVDGPVALDHPDLTAGSFHALTGAVAGCQDAASAACRHGTFVAGILAARRGAAAPAIVPGCTVLVRPIFTESAGAGEVGELTTTPQALTEAIVECVDAGAQIINVSAALARSSVGSERDLGAALDHSLRRGVLVVAAAGNEGALTGSGLTRHPWVIPVAGYSRSGRPLAHSNLGRSVGTAGLGAPGESVVSLAPDGRQATGTGTSVATPFVTGAAALLWSVHPAAPAAAINHALRSSSGTARRTVAPPLLDAWAAYELLSGTDTRRAAL